MMMLARQSPAAYLHQIQFKGAIFDLDGVLVSTSRYHYLAWKELARKLGFDFTPEDNERLKGVSRVRSLQILLEIGGITLDDEAFRQALVEKNARYVKYISEIDKSEVLPGAERYLIRLKENNIRIALGSASKNAPAILKRLELSDYFDGVADGNNVGRAKPDPEVFLLASELIGIAPKDCAVFEDSEAGIAAANSAGMFSVGIGSAEILNKADIIVPGLCALI